MRVPRMIALVHKQDLDSSSKEFKYTKLPEIVFEISPLLPQDCEQSMFSHSTELLMAILQNLLQPVVEVASAPFLVP